MPFKWFYRYLKIVSCLYVAGIIFSGLVFFYTIFYSQIIDIIMTGIIFFSWTIVGWCLLKYFGKAIVSFRIESDEVILINAKRIQFRMKRDNCIRISDTENRVVLEFCDGEKYYIHKYYFFYKKFFDFSELNNDNFKNASIIDL